MHCLDKHIGTGYETLSSKELTQWGKIDDLELFVLWNVTWPYVTISKSFFSKTTWPILLKLDEMLVDPESNRMMWSKLKKSKKGHIRSTLTLGARKSVKVKGQGQGHIW